MTTETRRLLRPLLLALLALYSCTFHRVGRRGGLPEDVVADYPPAIAAAYEVFAYKCSRCHSLARPLGADITNFDHWRAYVARMRRHAGSGISPEDAETVLVFLRYYSEQKAREAGVPFADSSTTAGGAR